MKICMTFLNVSALRNWLEDKNQECGSPESFNEWLQNYFDEGNEIIIHEDNYDFFSCLELI